MAQQQLREGDVSYDGQYIYDGLKWATKKEYADRQAALQQDESSRKLKEEFSNLVLDDLSSEDARDGAVLTDWNNSYLNTKNRLNAIIADSGTYSKVARNEASLKLKALEAKYATGSKTAYAALGKTAKDKDTPTIGQLAVYAKSQQPPDTKAILQENVDAMRAVLGESANLELQYAPMLAEVTGQSQREQMLKNIQAATDTPEISALRSKPELTAAEQQTLAQYDAQFADTPTAELAAYTDTLFNQARQSGQLEQYQKFMPQFQKQYLEQLPGAEQTLGSLGQLGAQMSEKALQAPELTAFEQAIGGPTYGQELNKIAGPTSGSYLGEVTGPTYGQELNQVQGPVSGQYVSQVAGPTADMSLGGMQAYRPGEYTSNIAGPELQSKLGNIDQRLVSQYMGTMPGVEEGARRLGEQINLDLSLGRSLTPEQERMATQAARQAYADRGMALGPQAITAEVLGREELANQRYLQRQASAQQALGTISKLYQPALAQTYDRQVGAEQYGLGAQSEMFKQGMSKEDLQKTAQAQEYQQRLGLQQFGVDLQQQAYQQAVGREQLGLTTQAQTYEQAADREKQQAAIQGQQYGQALEKEKLGLTTQSQEFEQAAAREATQGTIQERQFNQALSRGEAESNRLQAGNTLQANAANIASSVLGTQGATLGPAMSAYFNVPPTQGVYGTAANQANNQYSQAGLNIANPTNPVITGLNMLPYQNNMFQYSNNANFAASYLQGKASQPSGGGGGGLCCFIMLEARYGNGVMDDVVRRYRDEHVTPRNRRGYYKLAEVFVPLMRKSKLFKFAVSKLFADPAVSYAKWYYGQNKHGWLFKPIQAFWIKIFNLLGEDVPFIRENGEVV